MGVGVGMNHQDRLRVSSEQWKSLAIPGLEHRLITIWIDYDAAAGQLHFNLVGMEVVTGEKFFEYRSHTYDRGHLGMAPLDLCASVFSALDTPVDPFP